MYCVFCMYALQVSPASVIETENNLLRAIVLLVVVVVVVVLMGVLNRGRR